MSRYEVEEIVKVEKRQKILMNHSEYENFREFYEQIQQLCEDNNSCETCLLSSFGLGNQGTCPELFAQIDDKVICIE